MIFLEGKVYAKVWKVTPAENGKYIDLQITTSEKNDDGEYINSSWFPRCIGKAVNTLKNVQRNDRILIKKVKLTNERRKQDDDSYKSFFKFLILDAEIVSDEDENNSTPAAAQTSKPKESKKAAQATTNEDAEGDIPW